MSDPPRLEDETLDPLIAEMLTAARGEAPRVRSVDKAILAVTGAAGVLVGQTSAGAAGSVATASLVKLAAQWTLLGTVVVGGGVTAVEVAPRVLSRGTVDTVSAPAPRVQTAGSREAEPQGAAATHAERVAPPEGPTAKNGTQAKSPTASSPSHEERLAQEVMLLDQGRLALARGNFARALEVTEQYLSAYPGGRLEQEARYLRMQAERALGNEREAEREARRLLELNPNGPHARAARKALE